MLPLVLVLLSAPLHAQERADADDATDLFDEPAAATGEAPQVSITNIDAIRPRPSLTDLYLREPLYAALPEEFVNDILAYSDERKWPAILDTAGHRKKHKAEIAACPAYVVATLPGGLSVLWLPAENEFGVIPEGPAWTVFVVATSDAFVAVEGSRAVPEGPKRGDAPPPDAAPTPPEDGETPLQVAETPPAAPAAPAVVASPFADQLDALIRALAGDFVSVKGAQRAGGGGLGGLPTATEFDTTAPLDGAQGSSLSAWSDHDITYTASFGTFFDAGAARAAYTRLVAAVDAAPLPCCALAKSEQGADVLRNTTYLPFDPTGKMAPGLHDMVLEVEYAEGFGHVADGSFGTVYTVTLRIHHQ
jgi:hypothetical protein